jgi:hypothetical protein
MFAEWTHRKLYFVTRMKDNAVYKVVKVIQEHNFKSGVIKEEKIKLQYKDGKQIKTVTLRRVSFIDDDNRRFVFITNRVLNVRKKLKIRERILVSQITFELLNKKTFSHDKYNFIFSNNFPIRQA